ncbi:MAG: DMT family transporter [Burkholderiales bacterium]|nr:DMT family transporter [Burkholderiales bacterium]MDE2276211.1 DMT family transporter [Burkholderiales bacterium]
MATERARAPRWPVAALLCNALVWGVSWWPFRQLELRGLHPLWATALIYALAALVIGVLRPVAWRTLWRTPALWPLLLAAGATNACFNWGVTVGDVVRVVLLFYLMPLWSVLLARLLLAEPMKAAALARAGLAVAGAAVLLWPAGGGLPLPRNAPEWLAVLGGASFALNNVLLRRLAAQPGEARALAMFLGGATVAGALAAGLSLHGALPWPPAPAAGWVTGALLMGAAFLASNLALQFGAARLPASTTAVVMVSEVLFATVSALLLGAGRLTPALLAGGALIVAAALLASRG